MRNSLVFLFPIRSDRNLEMISLPLLAFYQHGRVTIRFFSMGQGKVIIFPIIVWFFKHFLLDILHTKIYLVMFLNISNIFDRNLKLQ